MSNYYLSVLSRGVTQVIKNYGERIVKDRCCLVKGYAMFGQVQHRLTFVPFKSYAH